MKNIDLLVQKLTASPIFALTSSAKETSHTNFLAYLLQSEQPELVPVRDALRACLRH